MDEFVKVTLETAQTEQAAYGEDAVDLETLFGGSIMVELFDYLSAARFVDASAALASEIVESEDPPAVHVCGCCGAKTTVIPRFLDIYFELADDEPGASGLGDDFGGWLLERAAASLGEDAPALARDTRGYATVARRS